MLTSDKIHRPENKSRFAMEMAARFEAQKIAFAPVVFQTARCMIKMGVLTALEEFAEQGATIEQICAAADIQPYAAKLLLEGGMSFGAAELRDERFYPTRLGFMLQYDELTRINIDFIHDVCYLGLFDLEASIKTERPAGLDRVITGYSTIYEALQALPEQAKKSWFEFDHFYSDHSFGDMAEVVLKSRPKHVMDIGANTGKFSKFLLERNDDVRVSMVDLPKTLEVALNNVRASGFESRVNGFSVNMLDPEAQLPADCDTIWMSQFLCCFSESEVKAILNKARAALEAGGKIFIADTFWDDQPIDMPSFCIINTSPYFTAMANGNSKMYSLKDMKEFIDYAGLRVESEHGPFGYGNSLLEIGLK